MGDIADEHAPCGDTWKSDHAAMLAKIGPVEMAKRDAIIKREWEAYLDENGLRELFYPAPSNGLWNRFVTFIKLIGGKKK